MVNWVFSKFYGHIDIENTLGELVFEVVSLSNPGMVQQSQI